MSIVGNAAVRVLSVDKTANVIGITNGRNQKEILVTTTNSILLYGVDLGKLVYSWNVSFRYDLKVEVVYSRNSKQYIGVVSEHILRKWTDEHDFMDKGSKVTLASPVAAIGPISDEGNSVIVYENGSVGSLLNPTSKWYSPPGQCVHHHWVRFCRLPNSIHVAMILCNSETELAYHHVEINDDSDTPEVQTRCVATLRRIGDLKDFGFAYDHGRAEARTLLQWSDGTVQYAVEYVKDFKSEIRWKIVAPFDGLSGKSTCTVLMLTNHIVIAHYDDNAANITCSLYSLKYEFVTYKTNIQTHEGSVSKLQLFNVSGQLFVLAGSDILLLPASDESDLASLIGIRSKCLTSRDGECSTDKSLLWTSKGLVEIDDKLDKLALRMTRKKPASRFQKRLNHFSKQSVSEQVVCEAVFREIEQDKNMQYLMEALRYFRNIPENTLFSALQLYIRCEVDCCAIQNEELTSVLGTDPDHPVLDLIFRTEANSVFLLDYVRTLSVDETVYLLWYFYRCMKNLQGYNLSQAVNWMCVLLDGHFNQLVVSKSSWVHSFLAALHLLITDQCHMLEEMAALKELTSLLMCPKNALTSESQKKDYSIEMLILT